MRLSSTVTVRMNSSAGHSCWLYSVSTKADRSWSKTYPVVLQGCKDDCYNSQVCWKLDMRLVSSLVDYESISLEPHEEEEEEEEMLRLQDNCPAR